MDKKLEEDNVINKTDDLFLNEYNWDLTKDNNLYNFKIRLNIDNNILFSCSISESNEEKLYFENNFSLKDLHYYDKFKKIENINDIYIFLLTMIQDNHFDFEKKEEKEIVLTIIPYTKSEKLFKFILPKKIKKKCEICDRIHSGINYLRFMRDNNHNHNIINSNNINYNNNASNNNGNNDIILKILNEINLLKKENNDKNNEIKNLKKELYEQNKLLSRENQLLKDKINKITISKKNEEVKNINEMIPPKSNPIKINEVLINTNNFRPKKLILKVYKNSTILFNNNPNDLKYHSSIIKNLSSKGVNDIFEVFLSDKDNQQYLVSKNGKTHFLDVILLSNNQIITSLKGHNSTVTMVRYFINFKDKSEYLISADIEKNVIVWDISNNYNLLHLIKTEYIDNNIYSCCLFFDNFERNFIFTSCGLNRYKKNDTSYTKMYSFKDGNFVKNLIESNDNNTYYILNWFNEDNKINYLIELCEEKVVITDFIKNELYAKLLPSGFKVLKYYSGFIYTYANKTGRDFLCCSTSNGCVVIWDLLFKNLVYLGKISKVELYNIIQWNEKYAIISGGANKSIKIFDIQNYKEVNNIETGHSSNVNCIKKISHPDYGECLLSSGNDHQIKLWTI